MKGLPGECEFVVIGAGVAGLRAAIELAHAGRVLVLGKRAIADPRAKQAATGAAAALSDEDEVILHLQDTLIAGDGLCLAEAAKILVDEAPARIQEVVGWGAELAQGGTRLVFGSEGANSRNRMLHAQGGSTRSEVLRALLARAHSLKHISFHDSDLATTLQTDEGRVTGVTLLTEKGLPGEIPCSAVLLATGGMGQLYRSTTNPEGATGDGLAMAFRAGAEVSDVEFIQFHPTVLNVKKAPRLLLADALRSEGAYLRNIEMDRFMGKYHPMAEQAPDDLVARAIIHEMEVSRARDAFVYLDLTHLKAGLVQKHFSRIHAACLQYNVDVTEDLVPVCPAAHYAVGGVRTDLNGKTNVAGLYAAGEVAATGLHGANRFPSNSLLEGLVYGARAGKAMREELKESHRPATAQPRLASQNGPLDIGIEETIGQMQDAMWSEAGLVRTRAGMQEASKKLEALAPGVAHPRSRRAWEAANLHLAGSLVLRAGLAREESRGAHYRTDYPAHDDRKFLKHSVIQGGKLRFV